MDQDGVDVFQTDNHGWLSLAALNERKDRAPPPARGQMNSRSLTLTTTLAAPAFAWWQLVTLSAPLSAPQKRSGTATGVQPS